MVTDELLEKLLLRLRDDLTLSNWAAFYSLTVWRKVSWALGTNMGKFHETSITQDLVYSLYELGKGTKLPIELYESKDEKANGNDLELYIETEKGFLSYPIQAKIINRKFQYPKFHYENRNGKQLKLLINYAKSCGGNPLYVFYNCVGNYEWHKRGYERDTSLNPVELYGCSTASAFYLLEHFTQKVPGFFDIHPHHGLDMQTFFDKVINESEIPFGSNLKKYGIVPRYYSRQEIAGEDGWVDRTPLPSIGRIGPRSSHDKLLVLKETKQKRFNPKFRILVPMEKRRTTLVYMS